MAPDYLAHGPLSDPGKHVDLFAGLPADVSAPCRLIHGVLIHDDYRADLYGAVRDGAH